MAIDKHTRLSESSEYRAGLILAEILALVNAHFTPPQ
jgi:hypothetical protein